MKSKSPVLSQVIDYKLFITILWWILIANVGAAPDTLIGAFSADFPPFDRQYPNGYTVTPADKLNLQQLLNTHGTVILAPGDYRTGGLSSLTIGSNQQICGVPGENATKIPRCYISGGAQHVLIQGCQPGDIDFQTGGVTKDIVVKQVSNTSINGTGHSLDGALFVALLNTSIRFNNSVGGFTKNTRTIRQKAQGGWLRDWNGDGKNGQSTGNVIVWQNSMTSEGDFFHVRNIPDVTIIGTDHEANNQKSPYGSLPAELNVLAASHFRLLVGSGDQNNTPADYPVLKLMLLLACIIPWLFNPTELSGHGVTINLDNWGRDGPTSS
jgi:hypothetical protein